MTNRHPQGNAVDLGRVNNFSSDVKFDGGVSVDGEYKLTFQEPPAVGEAAAAGDESPGPFGNNVVVDGNCVVSGYDWLGQPMSEEVATGAGTKAFRKIAVISDGAAATWGSEFGLPYKTLQSGVIGDGTVTAADETDPATINTGDPRGTINFTDPADGETDKTLTYEPADPYYGIQQFSDFTAVFTA